MRCFRIFEEYLQNSRYQISSLVPLRELKLEKVPSGAGVYFFVAEGRICFPYPGGKNPILYIGQAKSLRKRIKNHQKNFDDLLNKKFDKYKLYWRCYEYGAKFGLRCGYLCCDSLEQKQLEHRFLGLFAGRYRSWPIANNAGAWNLVQNGEYAVRR